MGSESAVSTRSRHLELLAPWPKFAERFWYPIPGRPELGCFGSGFDNWGVQTNQKYLASLAVLALDPTTDFAAVGMSRDKLLARALAALRYELATHKSGTLQRTDGSRWGHTWISGLGIERMMHAVDQLGDLLTGDDRDGLRRVLTSEADWLLGEYEIVADPWNSSRNNRPESNLWNGAILHRAAMMYPDDPRCDAWAEKGTRYLVNSVSVPADAEDDTPVAGRPVRQWHTGANFFPNYALDHHGYLNVGYMVICLSNLAMLHYGFALRGMPAPEAVYHHGRDLWNVVRRLVFADGRLARIGGDSRQRHCYCQDYLLPALVFAADHWGDPLAPHLEAGQLALIASEQKYSGDGSFLSRRLGALHDASPYYFTRLESDKAACLSMAALWRRLRSGVPPAERSPDAARHEAELAGSWEEPEHGAMMHRGPVRLVSWSWRACERPQGLCLPPDDGSLAEWSECLAGRVTPLGEQRYPADGRSLHNLLRHMQRTFDGGFVTCGTTTDGAEVHLPEGYRTTDVAEHHLAAAALPDGHTMLRLELCRNGPRRAYFESVRGLKLNVANDLWNGLVRTYRAESGEHRVAAELDGRERVLPLSSPWVSVEDRIGVVSAYGCDGLAVYQTGTRRHGYGGSIHYDEICTSVRKGPLAADAGEVLLDNGTAVFASADHEAVAAYAREGRAVQATCSTADARALVAEGLDGRRYLFVANFAAESGADTVEIALPAAASASDLATGERFDIARGKLRLTVRPGEARPFRLG